MGIDKIRIAINQIDEQLLKLFNQRAALALQIGHLKKEKDLPIYDPKREKLIFEKMRNESPGPLDNDAIIRLFERVIDESRSLERIRSKQEEDV